MIEEVHRQVRKNYEYKDAIECNKLVNENIEYFLNHLKADSIASSLVKLSEQKSFFVPVKENFESKNKRSLKTFLGDFIFNEERLTTLDDVATASRQLERRLLVTRGLNSLFSILLKKEQPGFLRKLICAVCYPVYVFGLIVSKGLVRVFN